MRIISLVPAATEIVAALGCADKLVGRTHECDFPMDVIKAPVLTRPRIDVSRPGGEIDRAVRDAAADNLPLFELDEAAVIAANPSVIITQGLCPVCAIDEGQVRKLAAQIRPLPA